MGFIKGIKNIQERAEQQNESYEDYVKINWLKLGDGEVARIRFLQELDEDSEGYNADAGTGLLAVEHHVRGNFLRKFLCTAEDDGSCYGCEQHEANPKDGWKQKDRLYVNVLMQKLKNGEPQGDAEVAVLSQGFGDKGVAKGLVDFAFENGTITGQVWKLSRTGKGKNDTSWLLTSGKQDVTRYDVTQHELFDLSGTVRSIPYENQEAYSGSGKSDDDGQKEATSDAVDW